MFLTQAHRAATKTRPYHFHQGTFRNGKNQKKYVLPLP